MAAVQTVSLRFIFGYITASSRESIDLLMPLAEIPQGCSSNFPTLVAVSA